MKKLFFISMLFSGAMHVNGMNIDNNAFGEAYAENQQQDEQIEISVKKILKEMGFTEVKKLSEALDKDIFSSICGKNVKRESCKTRYTSIRFTKKNEELLSKNSKYEESQLCHCFEACNWDVWEVPECLMALYNKIQQWFKKNNDGKYTLNYNKIDELATMTQRTVKNSDFLSHHQKFTLLGFLDVSNHYSNHYNIRLLLDNNEILDILICYEDPIPCPESISNIGCISFHVYPKNH